MKLVRGLADLATITVDLNQLSGRRQRAVARHLQVGVIRGGHAVARLAWEIRRQAEAPTVWLRGGLLEWDRLDPPQAADLYGRVVANFMRWRLTVQADARAQLLDAGAYSLSAPEGLVFASRGAWYAKGVDLSGLALPPVPMPDNPILTIHQPKGAAK